MKIADYLEDPEIQRYVRNIPAGQYLFKQGEKAQTMFIVVDGMVQLFDERPGKSFLVSTLYSGFLGEKAIIRDTPYLRLFSAQAKKTTTVIEISRKDVDVIQRVLPDFMKRVLQILVERLEVSHFLIRSLRFSNHVERLIHCILYFSRTAGKKVLDGVEVFLSIESLQYHVDMDAAWIQGCLEDLVKNRLMIRGTSDLYLIPNQTALLEYIPTLKKHVDKMNLDEEELQILDQAV